MRKGIIILLIICFVFLITLLAACGTQDAADVEESNTTEDVEALFESDEVVNNFIIHYNSISGSPIIDISRGNIDEKCLGHTYDHQIEILDGADGAIHITLSADNDHPDMLDLRDAFRDIMLTLDPTLTDEDAYAAFDEAAVNPGARSDMKLGKIQYNCFWTVELSDGNRSFGRIEAGLPLE